MGFCPLPCGISGSPVFATCGGSTDVDIDVIVGAVSAVYPKFPGDFTLGDFFDAGEETDGGLSLHDLKHL